jgi:hypothetical protein
MPKGKYEYEKKCRTTTAAVEEERLDKWILPYFGRLDRIVTPPSPVIVGAKKYGYNV